MPDILSAISTAIDSYDVDSSMLNEALRAALGLVEADSCIADNSGLLRVVSEIWNVGYVPCLNL